MENLVHLGDLEVVLPLAAALACWLLAARAWRIALRWLLLFGAALCIVGATKIAYLGWGTGVHAVGFKAISGHAMSVTALYPFFAFVVLFRPEREHNGAQPVRAQTAPRRPMAPWTAMLAGLALGAIVSGLLVTTGEHSVAEALAGWTLGAAVSLGGAMAKHDLGAERMLPTVWWTIPVFALSATLMESAHVGYWMIRMALALSGSERPYSWDGCG